MAYQDKSFSRRNAIKVSLNDHEYDHIFERAAGVGEQPSVLARKALLLGMKLLSHGGDSVSPHSEKPRADQSLMAA